MVSSLWFTSRRGSTRVDVAVLSAGVLLPPAVIAVASMAAERHMLNFIRIMLFSVRKRIPRRDLASGMVQMDIVGVHQ